MYPALTRAVCRRIIHNQPITHSDCLIRVRRRLPNPKNVSACLIPNNQRRGIFGLGRTTRRQVKDASIAPGFEVMLQFAKTRRLRARPPPAKDLAEAFDTFFTAKRSSKQALTDVQANHALRVFFYLRDNPSEEGAAPLLTEKTIRMALSVLSKYPSEDLETHKTLARTLYEELCAEKPQDVERQWPDEDFLHLLRLLCESASTAEGRDRFLAKWDGIKRQQTPIAGRQEKTKPLDKAAWAAILTGFAREKNEVELLRSVDDMQRFGTPLDASHFGALIEYYAAQDDVEQAKRWWDQQPKQSLSPVQHTARAYDVALGLCSRKHEHAWAKDIIREITERNSFPAAWISIYRWAATTGKSVDEIDRMMQVTNANNSDGRDRGVNIDTVNALVEIAMAQKDIYKAERFINLGQKWKIAPNASTWILQMNYRLAGGDIDGARSAFQRLQSEELNDDEDVRPTNQLIQAMCAATHGYDVEAIMEVVDYLNQRKGRFEASTVACLARLHMQHEELHDTIDLLQTHAFHFSISERKMIADVFSELVLSRDCEVTRSWDAYIILFQMFGETPRDARTEFMNSFFERERPDLAVHVFNHMREHQQQETQPTVDTYVSCLVGIAANGDRESLDTVHNTLKLNSAVEPNTRLNNALLLAYTACDEPRRALDFWDRILESPEGPTYQSLRLALRACERTPFRGKEKARQIWKRIQKTDIDLNEELWTSYAAALAGQTYDEGSMGDVEAVLQEMEAATGQRPGAFVLGTVFNAAPLVLREDVWKPWMQERYPQGWAALDRLGWIETEHQGLLVKLDRTLEP